jgi:poly(ribitol-phosphate) beta-N-acetylglucosaminyltransferase
VTEAPATSPDRVEDDGGGLKVSVVIPVFNTLPYLGECLDSVLEQDLPADEFEIVAVDDGSTDGSGDLLDDYARRHPNVRVLHQENSGWPGAPRNAGRDASRGRYVFFADSDDRLAPGALRSMYEFAAANGSDVVVPKLVPMAGPRGPDYVFRGTQVDADLTRVISTLGPWKLFRRAFLDEHDLRFPEGKVRLEDGIFTTEAYLTAGRVSLLADGEYYLKRAQPGQGNISFSPVDPDGYSSSIARMIEIIRARCTDPSVADTMVLTLYRRKALKWFGPDRFPGYRPARREAWVAAVRALAEKHVPPRLDEMLPLVHRTRSLLVRHGEVDALVAIGAAELAGHPLEVVIVEGWLELHVPGLAARPALVAAPGLRLVPAADVAAAGDMSAGPAPAVAVPPALLLSFARRHLVPLAERSVWGRRGLAWARRRLRNRAPR